MADEETELWRRWREGDEGARCELLSRFKRLVISLARSKARGRRGVEVKDLTQEGMRALVEALDHFDEGKGLICGYVHKCVSTALGNCSEHTRGVSRDNRKRYKKAEAARGKLTRESEREPTLEEVARESGLKPAEVANARTAIEIANAGQPPEGGLDSFCRGGAGDAEAVKNETIDRERNLERIRQALYSGKFRELDRKVIIYYLREMEDSEIEERLHLRRGHARKIRERTIKKLASMLNDTDNGTDKGEEHEA